MTQAITVQNLGKKYFISHQGRSSYLALRDVIADGAKGLFSPCSKSASTEREEFWALKEISFEVKQGERIGIIGRNGAGKSTLLKILSRITDPTEGRVRIRGRVASLLEVGTGFHPELTGRENIFLNGTILGMSRVEIRKKFDEIVDFAEIEKFLDTPVKRYSSGMYVRLAFAVAAHLEPEILIVDEVLAVGDAQFQKKCLGKMESVSTKEGRTVLFVSHSMPTIKALCTKVMLLEKGALILQGKAEDVVNIYLFSSPRNNDLRANLVDAPRSAGKHKAIQHAWLENDKGEVVAQVPMGNQATLCFNYKLDQTCANLDFGFGIESIDGMRIFSVNNTVTNPYPLAVPLHGVARCEIPELPLLPGEYLVSLSIVDSQVEWIDFVERAISFEVLANDVYGTGKIFERSQGVVFTRSQVNISEI